MWLAPANSCSENIRVHAVIVAELELSDVQRHIFLADLVERADDTALEDRPEAFNRVGVNCTYNVLAKVVLDALARILSQAIVNLISVGCEQANFLGNHFAHECLGVLFGDMIEHAGDDIALALNGTDDRSFIGPTAKMSSLVPMFVLILATDECFVHFDDTAELLFRLDHGRADFVTHGMCGVIRAETQLPLDLECTYPLLAGRHEMNDLEPLAQRLVGVLKDRPGDDTETIAVRVALLALPVPLASMQVIDRWIAATRAVDALRPAAGLQIGFWCIVVTDWEHILKLSLGHLVDRLRMFFHGGYPSNPSMGGYCHV